MAGLKATKAYDMWFAGLDEEVEICIVKSTKALCERANAADIIVAIMEVTNAFTVVKDISDADFEYVHLVDVDSLLEFFGHLANKLDAVYMDLLNKVKSEKEAWEQYKNNVMELQKLVEQFKGVLRHMKHLECKLGLRPCNH